MFKWYSWSSVSGDFTVLESILEQEEADLIDYVQFMAKRHSPLTETNLMDMLMVLFCGFIFILKLSFSI